MRFSFGHVGALMFVVGPTGCHQDDWTCPQATPWIVGGSATYVGTQDSPPEADAAPTATDGTYGSFPATVGLVAFDPRVENNSGDSSSSSYSYCGANVFTIAVLGLCSLTASPTMAVYDSGDGTFLSAGATVRPGQSCDLAIAGGTSTLAIQTGSLTMTPTTLNVTLAGAATGSVDGYVTVRFDGTTS